MNNDTTQKIIIANNIKELLKINKISQKQLATQIGIAPSTLSDYLNLRSRPSHGVVQKMANFFQVSKSDIDTTYKKMIETNNNHFYTNTTERQQKTINRYLKINAQEKIDDYVDMVFASEGHIEYISNASNLVDFAKYKKVVEVANDFIEEAPLRYEVKAPGSTAAGSGFLYGDVSHGTVNVSKIPSTHFDFVLNVVGDSMEPKIADGSIVFVKSCSAIGHGEIGIFETENGVTCKKLFQENGTLELHSLNKKYPPIIPIEIRCIGKVVFTK